MKKWLSLALLGVFLICRAETFPPEWQDNGTLRVQGQTFALGFATPNWRESGRHNVSITGRGLETREGVFTAPNGKFQFFERFSREESGRRQLAIRLKSETPVAAEQLFFGTTSGALLTSGIRVDGKALQFGPELGKTIQHIIAEGPHTVDVPLAEGSLRLTGQFGLLFQDNRKWDQENATIRIFFTPYSGEITAAELNLTLEWIEYSGTPLALTGANSFLRDEVEGDQKGGWTDQGAQDMRLLPQGEQRFAGLPFLVTERCLGFYHARTPFYPKEITVPGGNQAGKYLYLLHAEGWEPLKAAPLGEIRFDYADGTHGTTVLDSARDCGNFYQPKPRPNAVVAWKGNHGSAVTGIYVTRVPTRGKPIRDITFRSAGSAIWLIAGLTLSDDAVSMYHAAPLVMKADSEWRPIKAAMTAEPGSVLDFSFLLDAPAGKYGQVRNRDGRFGFENAPEKTIRFYGANICFEANFIDRALAGKLARIMRERGYNLLRFHHFERDLIRKDAAVSTEIDPAKMALMDGIFAEAKAAGVYLTLDLFISRPLKPGEVKEFPERTFDTKDFKQLIIASPSALENWKTFAKNFLTHVNPHTGLAWKDDPALLSINLINEGNIQFDFNGDSPANRLFRQRYPEWLKENRLHDPDGNDIRLWRRFIVESYRKTHAEMVKFLRELGVKAMLHDQNMESSVPLTIMRQDYDLVDNHFYHSHPSFPEARWRLPISFFADNTAQSLAAPLGDMFASRIFGKPFISTEWDYCNPAPFVAEGALATGAYAALNDWDGLCHFQILGGGSKGGMHEAKIGLFTLYGDPIRTLADRIGALLFLRGDVRPSEACRVILTPPDYLEQLPGNVKYPTLTKRFGLLDRTGTVIWKGGELPAGTKSLYLLPGVTYQDLPAGIPTLRLAESNRPGEIAAVRGGFLPQETEEGIYRSSTGEIELNRGLNRLCVVTPRSEAFSLDAQGRGDGSFMSVANRESPGVFLAASMTREPLKSSRRILLLHLTQVRNTGMTFRDDTATLLDDYGKLPLLLRRAEAEITLRAADGMKLYACDDSGKRLYELPLQSEPNGGKSFIADNYRGNRAVMVYELAAE